MPEERLRACGENSNRLLFSQEEPDAQLRPARCLAVKRSCTEERSGRRLDQCDARAQLAHHLDRRINHHPRRRGDASQRSSIELDLDHLDDPILSPDVGRLNGLEEKVLGGILAVGGGNRHRRLENPRRRQTYPHPWLVPSRAWRQPRGPRARAFAPTPLRSTPHHTRAPHEQPLGGRAGLRSSPRGRSAFDRRAHRWPAVGRESIPPFHGRGLSRSGTARPKWGRATGAGRPPRGRCHDHQGNERQTSREGAIALATAAIMSRCRRCRRYHCRCRHYRRYPTK